MKKQMVKFIALAGVFFLTITLLALFLFSGTLISDDAIRENFGKSAIYFMERDAFAFDESRRLSRISDNYADSIMLNVAWNMKDIKSAIDSRYFLGESGGENMGLYLTVTENAMPDTDYTRYWHGSSAVIRLFHLFTDVSGIKRAGLFTAILLALLTAGLLAAKKHGDIAILFLLSLASVRFWDIGLSLEYQSAFILALLFCSLYLIFERKGDFPLLIMSVAGGAAIAFFDFLTAETLVILLPLMLTISVRSKEGRLACFKESLKFILTSLGLFGASYGGAFLSKWALATIITGENAFLQALSSAHERIGEAGGGFLPSVTANLTVLFGGFERIDVPRVVFGVILCILILLSLYYLFRKKEKNKDGALLLLILGAVVLFRFTVLRNHSYLHQFFTFRALASTVFGLLMTLYLNISYTKKRK